MQLLLSFAEPKEPENESSIWLMLPVEQRQQAIAVLAKLLAKAAANVVSTKPTNAEEQPDE
jgi:hypothetical protein